MIREITNADFDGLMTLYMQLHGNPFPEKSDEAYRKRGLATACLDFAKEIALRENCYKMMLLTGSKSESTLNFYERAGYNRNDKTAFIQWS